MHNCYLTVLWVLFQQDNSTSVDHLSESSLWKPMPTDSFESSNTSDDDFSSVSSELPSDCDDDSDSDTDTQSDCEEDCLLDDVLESLELGHLQEVTRAADHYLEDLNLTTTADFNDPQINMECSLELSFEGMQLTDQINESFNSEPLPHQFGLKKTVAPPLLCRHPEPYAGRDDDPVKLREIAEDVMTKLGIDQSTPEQSVKIIFGPDHKIGKNLLQMVTNQKKYDVFLPEFPCLHLRKSRITVVFSAFKSAGLIELLQIMRGEENTDWAKLISANHIDVATRNIMRLAISLRLAFILKFSTQLLPDRSVKFFEALKCLPGASVAADWDDEFTSFLDSAAKVNVIFALHRDMLHHLEGIVALSLAECLGGTDGYNLLLASTKSSLKFSFLNGATSYSPYCVQLLHQHHKAGYYFKELKKCLFSKQLTEGGINMATDTKREMDHQVITKGFRSGSTMESVLRRTALADDLADLHKMRDQERHQEKKKTQQDQLGWKISDNDINHIIPTTVLILQRNALSLEPDSEPANIYTKKKVVLSASILEENCSDVGEFLIKRYLAKNYLFEMTGADLPTLSQIKGPKQLVGKAFRSKGVTIKRTSGRSAPSENKTDRQKKEDTRKKVVKNAVLRVECLTSEMNACQALVKPDCSKPKVTKSSTMADALKVCLLTCLDKPFTTTSDMDKALKDKKLIISSSKKQILLEDDVSMSIKEVIIEFAGVKFKTKAISGSEYLKYIQETYLEKTIQQFPQVNNITIVEEKYSFTPDKFKGPTRQQREQKSSSINHLLAGKDFISKTTFSKDACITSAEGKSLVSKYLAMNVETLKLNRNVSVIIDSEFILEGCSSELHGDDACSCPKYCIPIKCNFNSNKGAEKVSHLNCVQQRKGEAEMAQADWLLESLTNLKPGEGVACIVSSGDIDSIVINLFVISRQWPRNADRTFQHSVFVILQKPSAVDVYNMTAIIETLESAHPTDLHIAEKVSLILCVGGNDFVPKLHGLNHKTIMHLFLTNDIFKEGLFQFEDNHVGLDAGIYVQLVKSLYLRKKYSKDMPFETARKLSMMSLPNKRSMSVLGSLGQTKDPKNWLPPHSALIAMSQLITLQIQYLLTAGHHNAPMPDFLSFGCLKENGTGEIEYNFGVDSFLTPAELAILTSPCLPLTPKKKKGNKRSATQTPQKGRRRKIPLTSTPVKKKLPLENN